MQTRVKPALVALLVGISLTLVGCGQYHRVMGMKAFKEANTLYQQQDYRAAATRYEEAVEADPNLTAAFFYLGNSYDNLYKPSRKGEKENDDFLAKAVANYETASQREQDPKMKKLALQYLVAAYGPDKYDDPSKAEPIILQMIQLEPTESGNYFVLSKMYEDAGRYDDAEATLLKAKQARPDDPAVYLQLAGYYNRQGEFEKTIEALQQRTEKEPNNPEGYYTMATYYWEKAYRDFSLTEPEKRDFIQKGLDSIDKALQIKSDYMEAMVYKNILLRLKANIEKDPGRQQALIKEADVLRDKANELRKQRAAGVS